MYTKEQLQAMSDFEVNKTLARMIYGYPEDKDIAKRIHSGAIDFCNAPNDIMPLAFDHSLNISSPDSLQHAWNVYDNNGLADVYDLNPLRAIACCLILVLQER